MGGLNFPSLDEAIAGFENVNPTYNNPGGIMSGPFAAKYGAVGSFGQTTPLAVFPTPEAGLAALDANVTNYANQGKTVQQMVNAWSPGTAPGNTPQGTQSYLDYVSGKLGVPPSTPLSQLGPGVTAPFVPPPAGVTASTQGYTSPGWMSAVGNFLAGTTGVPAAQQAPNTIGGFSVSRITAGILGFMFIFAGLAMLALAGVEKVADVVLGGHEGVQKAAAVAAVLS